MRKLAVNTDHLTTKEIKKILLKQEDIRLFRYWYLIHYMIKEPGKTANEYSDILAFGKFNIYRIVKLYNKDGQHFTDKLNWGGRRKLTYETEKTIIRKLKRNKKWTVPQLTKAVQNEYGTTTLPTNYIEKLIQKHELVIPKSNRKLAKR